MPTLVSQPDETASNDNFINQQLPTTNSGNNVVLACGSASAINSIRRFQLMFDLSSLTGMTIVSSILTLVCTAENAATDYNIGLHRAITEFFELGSTWNLRNTSGSLPWAGGAGGGAGSDYVALATATRLITGAGTFTWDVTADVAGFAAGTYTNRGWWGINVSEATLNSNKAFASATNATPSNRPLLTTDWLTPSGLLMRMQLHAAQRRRS